VGRVTPPSSFVVIKLEGELEIGRKAEIAQTLVVEPTATGLLLDFSAVTYADSTVLAELLRFRATAEANGVPVAIIIASRQFARLIEYAGLSQVFAIFENRAQALTYLAANEAR
jgi:anti-anti-sigma factor